MLNYKDKLLKIKHVSQTFKSKINFVSCYFCILQTYFHTEYKLRIKDTSN